MILDHLALARRHVADGYVHIARQRALIVHLEAKGEDSALARQMLRSLEEMQARHIADCQHLEKAWETNGQPFSPEDAEVRSEGAQAVRQVSIQELRWFQAQIAETGNVLRRSREMIDASRQILSKFEHVGLNVAADDPPAVTR